MTKTELLPCVEEPKQKIIFSSSDNAEQLLKKLECFAESILAKYSDKTNTDSEEAGYANAMLMRVRQTRRFMADAIRSQHKEDMSLNMNAAVREAMNAVLDFMWIHNSAIGENYLRGEAYVARMRGFAKQSANSRKLSTEFLHNTICNQAKRSMAQGISRGETVKNLAIRHKKSEKHIRNILKSQDL